MENKPAPSEVEKKPFHFYKLLIVIGMALAGYIITSNFLAHSTIQYTSPKKYLFRTVPDAADESGRSEVTFAFPVHSRIPADTTKTVHKREHPATNRFHHSLLYHENPHLLIWLTLISAMMAFAAGACPVFLAQIRQTRHKFQLNKGHVLAGYGYALALALLLMVSNQALPGYYKPENIIDDLHIVLSSGWILQLVVGIAVGLTLPSFALIFLIGLSSYKASKEKDLTTAVHRIKQLNADLQRVLKLLTVIVVFSVLTACMLGSTFRATVHIDGFDIYPPEVGYLYGAYFTIFLCIIYFPIYYYIKYLYNLLKEKALEPQQKAEEAKNLEALFQDKQLDGNVMDNIKMVLTLLLPLISSFIPQGLNLFS